MNKIVVLINTSLNYLFRGLLFPFQNLPPYVGLTVISIITGLIIALIYNQVSNQSKLEEITRKIKAYLLQLVLFRHDLKVILSAQRKLLFYNLLYTKENLKPLLVMILPIFLIMVQLNSWYGYKPLEVGERALLTLTVKENSPRQSPVISLENPGLLKLSEELYIPKLGQYIWRMESRQAGSHKLKISYGNQEIEKIVTAGKPKKLPAISPIRSSHSGKALFNPQEVPLEKGGDIEEVNISYREAKLSLPGGLRIPWLLYFFIISLLFGLVFKKLTKSV